MSQEKPQIRAHDEEHANPEPVKYGDVFQVAGGDLADKAVAPQDAAMMQAAEARVLGQTTQGGPAAAMQAAATFNERAGLVGHSQVTDVAGQRGVSVTETDVPGSRIITEAVAGHVVGQYVQPTPVATQTAGQGGYSPSASITMGEALEAASQTAGNKPVNHSDAAAIQAAEVRATGVNSITPGGLAASAQSAASYNDSLTNDNDKVKLADVLAGAAVKLPADKAVTRQDAEGVVSAELRNNPEISTYPGGVAASVAAAARLNERQQQ